MWTEWKYEIYNFCWSELQGVICDEPYISTVDTSSGFLNQKVICTYTLEIKITFLLSNIYGIKYFSSEVGMKEEHFQWKE